MQLGFRLEGVVQCHQKRRLPDVFQDLPFRPGVLRGFGLLHDRRLFQYFHGIQLPGIMTTYLTD